MTTWKMIIGIIPLIYILIVSPYLLGSLLCCRLEGVFSDSYVFRYVVGFFSQIGIWGFLALPVAIFFYKDFPFHILCYIFLTITVVLSIVRIIMLVKERKSPIEHFRRFTDSIRQHFNVNLLCRLMLIIFLCMTALQLFRAIYGIRAAYDDNHDYITEATKTLFDDRLFVPNIKRVLSPWQSYLAVVSLLGMQHPLFIGETILPICIFFAFYMQVYLLGKYFFIRDMKKEVYFLFIFSMVVLIFEYYVYYPLYALAAHPVIWGKTILGTTALPMLILIFCELTDETYRVKPDHCWLLMLMGAGSTCLTAVAMVTIPIAMFILMVLRLVQKQNRTVICYAFFSTIATICQFGVYLWNPRG